jgi:8-oxo-dGTP diphosphatase
MDKKIRNAVRTYLIENDRVVVVNYNEHDNGYYDIPGGKIEDGETPAEASIREFKEETGITIKKQHCIGHNTVEYPEKIFEFDIFVVDEYVGKPLNFEENNSMWFKIENLKKETKLYPSIEVIKYLNGNINLKTYCDDNHNILNIEVK